MNVDDKLKNLIKEEEKILNSLIQKMDKEMLRLDAKLTDSILQAKKAKEKCLPDTYGMLVKAADDKIKTRDKIVAIRQSRDELYDTRIVVEAKDMDSEEEIELKIGLHTFSHNGEIYVCSWKRPVCRHYLLDNTSEEYRSVIEKNGERYITDYRLKLKRKINLRFDKVKEVTHLFPMLSEEYEDVIADEFLQELLYRRSDKEFRNIVFTIQKHQGEIIKTPFQQDLIVQGCAGSGKSMIMLHRLPILLYDNPNSLDRNNLYIITPSLAYIQMADNMRHQLEIADLKMGTLNQYYDYIIGKYGYNPEVYGDINPGIKLTPEQEKYVYSEDCIEDIRNAMKIAITDKRIDYTEGLELFGISKREEKNTLPQEIIFLHILQTQDIIKKNAETLLKYYNAIRASLEGIDRLRGVIANRKINILRAISRLISNEEEKIHKLQKEIERLDKEENKIAYYNRMRMIEKARQSIIDYIAEKESIENNVIYFEDLELINLLLDDLFIEFTDFKNKYEENSWQDIYCFISKSNNLVEEYISVSKELLEIGDPYEKYVDSMEQQVNMASIKVTKLKDINLPLLRREYYQNLIEANSYYTSIKSNLPIEVYLTIMKRLNQAPDKKNDIKALSCSPYLYVQILFTFQGAPNAIKESLITIDEAQSLAPQEIALIKNTNDNMVVLNLFGDENQHIEGTKGIDNWSEITNIGNFERYDMLENYRNARQITEYCNHRFHMKMRAINLDGRGVHEICNIEELSRKMVDQFQNAQKQGLCAIIVKDIAEANFLLKEYETYQQRIHDMTNKYLDIHRTRWNLLTVEQAKGLEFETVIAVTGRMTQNEKYITYTRALDELYVFDEEITLLDWAMMYDAKHENKEKILIKKERSIKDGPPKKDKNLKQKTDFSKSLVREYFEGMGLNVKDMRISDGKFWVIGERDEIEQYVKEAISKFGISGAYSSSKDIEYRPGWYTKTKK